MQALFEALDVDPLDIISLVFAWKLRAKTPLNSRDPNLSTAASISVQNRWRSSRLSCVRSCPLLRGLLFEIVFFNFTELTKTYFPSLSCTASFIEPLNNDDDFRSFYMLFFAFTYDKPIEQRSLPIEVARQLFPLILEGLFAHIDLWIEFLEGRKHASSRDTYSLLFDFARNIDYDLKNFDEENGTWPVLLDEFVDLAKPRIAQDKDCMD